MYQRCIDFPPDEVYRARPSIALQSIQRLVPIPYRQRWTGTELLFEFPHAMQSMSHATGMGCNAVATSLANALVATDASIPAWRICETIFTHRTRKDFQLLLQSIRSRCDNPALLAILQYQNIIDTNEST